MQSDCISFSFLYAILSKVIRTAGKCFIHMLETHTLAVEVWRNDFVRMGRAGILLLAPLPRLHPIIPYEKDRIELHFRIRAYKGHTVNSFPLHSLRGILVTFGLWLLRSSHFSDNSRNLLSLSHQTLVWTGLRRPRSQPRNTILIFISRLVHRLLIFRNFQNGIWSYRLLIVL